MSHDEEDAFWNTSEVKPFSFEDEDQTLSSNIVNQNSSYAISTNSNISSKTNSGSSGIKTLGNILAAKVSSGEPFLKPSIIMCNGDKIEKLIQHLDKCYPQPNNIDNTRKQDPKIYISDIINKRVPIDFSPYKSKREKLLLLDCAICCSDGNTITAATIFISKTLKQSIFISELKRRPIAVDHYMNYLELTNRSREAIELSKQLNAVQ